MNKVRYIIVLFGRMLFPSSWSGGFILAVFCFAALSFGQIAIEALAPDPLNFLTFSYLIVSLLVLCHTLRGIRFVKSQPDPAEQAKPLHNREPEPNVQYTRLPKNTSEPVTIDITLE